MPIPILKGLRRVGPQVDTPRTATNPSNIAKIPTLRSNASNSSNGGGTSAPSSIPSLQGGGGKEQRGGRAAPVIRHGRGGVSRPGVQSPRPPPRISSVVTSPRTPVKLVTKQEQENKVKTAQIKKPEAPPESNDSCAVPSTNSLLIPSVNNSNRSSVISNSSSIPAPSSSSSNRNSNSSISSNFSVGSWNSSTGVCIEQNEEKSFVGRGSGTFPRTTIGARQSADTDGSLSASVHVESHIPSRGSLQRSTHKYRGKDVTQIGSKIATSSSLSSSESAITNPRRRPQLSNHSDTNLSRLKEDDSYMQIDNTVVNGRTIIPKPSGTLRGANRNCNNFSGLSYVPSVNKTADICSNKSRQSGTARSPHLARTHRNRHKSVNSPAKSKEGLGRNTRIVKNATVLSSLVDSTDEDDGYSSIAHTDHQDDDENHHSPSKNIPEEDNDYDEVQDMEPIDEVEPMKPLEGLSRYSYVLNSVDSTCRLQTKDSFDSACDSNDCGGSTVQNTIHNTLQSNSWSETGDCKTASQSVYALTRSTDEGLRRPSAFIQQHSHVRDIKNKNAAIMFQSLSPRFERSVKCSSNGTLSAQVPQSELGCSNQTNSMYPHSVSLLKPTGVNPHNAYSSTSDASMSNLDDSVLSISYKNYVKDTNTTASKEQCSWMVRNTIAVSVPVTQPRRKYGGGLSAEKTSSSSFTSPSLPTLYGSRISDTSGNTKSAPPPRPSSLASPGKLPFGRSHYSASALSPQFIRSYSLRSPSKNDSESERKVTHPFSRTVPTTSANSVTSSPVAGVSSFVRNSVKYSTVIPRTAKEGQKRNYSSSGEYTNEIGPSLRKGEAEEGVTRSIGKIPNEDYFHLQGELVGAREKVLSLTEQLSSSNKLVAAYEHSLSNMTQRLQQLTKITEQKEAEAAELRRLLERTCLDNSGVDSRASTLRGRMNRSSSIESMTSLASNASFSSAISTSSALSYASNSSSTCEQELKDKSPAKKKSWLRSSFTKAFKRREKRKRSDILPPDTARRSATLNSETVRSMLGQSATDPEGFRGYCSLPASPLPKRFLPPRFGDDSIDSDVTDESNMNVRHLMDEISSLKKMLRDKESSLTESRLETLSSAHQIDALKESVHHLSGELASLKLENQVQQSTHYSNDRLSAPEYDTGSVDSFDGSQLSSCSQLSYLKSEIAMVEDGKNVRVNVQRFSATELSNVIDVQLGVVTIHCRTSWEELDSFVNKVFEDYLDYIDPVSRLGLSSDSILHYQLGEIRRTPMLDHPELLPYGYLVGDVESVEISLQSPSLNSIDSIVLESLISKPHLHRYVSLLREHRRVVLSGPEGVGKSILARRLAEFVVQRLGIEPSIGNIAQFNVREHRSQDLSAYLSQLSDLCEAKSTDLPLVIVLESLEKVDKLSEVLTTSLRVSHDQCPFIIGTLKQCGIRGGMLKIHHSFRLVTLDPTQDPVVNILPRLCRRSQHINRLNPGIDSESLEYLFEWLPRCWNLIHKVLLSSGVAEITAFGPGVLLPFPASLTDAQLWFFDIWKSCLLPKLQKAAENLPPMPKDLEKWQELDKCLREELPWSSCSSGVSLPGLASVH